MLVKVGLRFGHLWLMVGGTHEKGKESPSEIYHGMQTTSSTNYIRNKDIIMEAKSEYVG